MHPEQLRILLLVPPQTPPLRDDRPGGRPPRARPPSRLRRRAARALVRLAARLSDEPLAVAPRA
jgi:hypothetical protein